MKKLLTKANGYVKTTYTFINHFNGNRRVYSKGDEFFIECEGKVFNVTDKRHCFYNDSF